VEGGCPSFTATNVPRHVAVIFPCALERRVDDAALTRTSIAFARRWSVTPVGVGRLSFTANSLVTVHGGADAPFDFISVQAAVQLLWQSRRAPMIPPLTIPSNAMCGARG